MRPVRCAPKRAKRSSPPVLGLLAALAAGPQARGQAIVDPTAPPVQTPTPPLAGGGESRPAPPSAITFTGAYTLDLLSDVSGGVKPGLTPVDLLKVSAAYDGATGGHPGYSALVSVIADNGGNFTGGRVGGFQAVSSTEAQPGAFKLYELWVQREILQGAGVAKAGFIDLNTTFDVQETAALFLSASQGIGPDIGDSGRNGPSIYPTPALAVAGVYRPAEGWTAQVGVFDGVAGNPAHRSAFAAVSLSSTDGALLIGQIERRFGDAARIEVGAWTYTGSFPSLDRSTASGAPAPQGGDGGAYALAEGRILGAGGEKGDLSGWVRVGLANGDINRAASYLGAGVVYIGAIPGRDKDEVGVALARVGFGAGGRAVGATAGEETDLEATYRFAIKDWLNVQPDMQYVIHPAGDRHRSDAFVIGLRVAATVSR